MDGAQIEVSGVADPLASRYRLFASTLIACMAADRAPSDQEVLVMAERIGIDVMGHKLPDADPLALGGHQNRMMLAARLALGGDEAASRTAERSAVPYPRRGRLRPT